VESSNELSEILADWNAQLRDSGCRTSAQGRQGQNAEAHAMTASLSNLMRY
jgi:hypothetical protein